MAVSKYIAGKLAPGSQGLTYLTSLYTATCEIKTNSIYAQKANNRGVLRFMIGDVLQEQATF